MPFLIAGAERFALRIGTNVLGGQGADAVPLTSLAGLAPAAVITVQADRTSLIQRLTAGVVVTLDGESLDSTPQRLAHGARLGVGPCRLMYANPSPVRDEGADAPTEIAPPVPAAEGTGRLIALGTGHVHPVPGSGLVLGRGGSADVSLDGKGISRRHAVVRPDGPAFSVTDESANGTFVNGERVSGTRTLAHGDVLRVGGEEFRLEVGAVLRPSGAEALSATELVAGVADPPRTTSRSPRAPAHAAPSAASAGTPVARPLALLEITSGPLAGSVFRIERPVCAIGRGEQNDVNLADGSVSASHATLLLKRGTWHVVDLQSAHGTYVDDYRVAGERALPNGASIRAGDVTMRLRVLTGAPKPTDPTQAAGGFWRRLSKRWSA